MSRHRNLTVEPGQDAAATVGRVVWRRRRSNGDEVVVRAVRAPRPHVRLEVWRGPQEHVVHLAVPELAEVAAALLTVPRLLAVPPRVATPSASSPPDAHDAPSPVEPYERVLPVLARGQAPARRWEGAR